MCGDYASSGDVGGHHNFALVNVIVAVYSVGDVSRSRGDSVGCGFGVFRRCVAVALVTIYNSVPLCCSCSCYYFCSSR